MHCRCLQCSALSSTLESLLFTDRFGGWRNGLAIMKTCCSYRGPEFSPKLGQSLTPTTICYFSGRGSDILLTFMGSRYACGTHYIQARYSFTETKFKRNVHLCTFSLVLCEGRVLLNFFKCESNVPMSCLLNFYFYYCYVCI